MCENLSLVDTEPVAVRAYAELFNTTEVIEVKTRGLRLLVTRLEFARACTERSHAKRVQRPWMARVAADIRAARRAFQGF